jgi:hypothetical protein
MREDDESETGLAHPAGSQNGETRSRVIQERVYDVLCLFLTSKDFVGEMQGT